MIKKSTTMLYVNDTTAAMEFWTEKMGFVLLETADFGEAISYEVAPSLDSSISFGLHDKAWMTKTNPQMNLGFPSLLFTTDDLEKEHARLTENGVTVHPIMEYNGLVNFTFTDNEGNYIAITQK